MNNNEIIPEEIKKFAEVFEKLPSIGPRQALRLAFRLVGNGTSKIDDVEKAVSLLKNIKICSKCFFVHTEEGDECKICSDKSRDKCTFMIVEKETDLISIEQTGAYRGQYLIIGDLVRSGALEQWQKSRLEMLKSRIKNNCKGTAKEIIIALNPNTYGDLNASLLSKELKDYAKKITRLGRGIPTGGEIEFADPDTLSSSITRRE